MLVQNEERFLDRALRNSIEFCDRMICVDNASRDRTPEILENLHDEFGSKIELHRADHPRLSHQLIRPFAGTDTWIFGVDGDEIYDPEGLRRLRDELEAGKFDRHWVVFGNVLNVTRLEAGFAEGHLAPPCRSMTKLYNFRAIDDWTGDCVERLHGGTIQFRTGFSEQSRFAYHEQHDWESSNFRCLHLCFLTRSSLDTDDQPRRNIMDRHAWSLGKIADQLKAHIQGKAPKNWKHEKYARGPVVKKDLAAFHL